MNWFEGFERRMAQVNGVDICYRVGGRVGAPPLLLLHGAPQSHVMWHRVAQGLRDDFFLVMPDLRGYGDSSHAPGLPDHSNYSKRAMAQDVAELMTQLGHARFQVCGHDRGGRVTHRLCLDHAQRVQRATVIDIAPTLDMYNATTMEFARAYYHWFHLIQPQPLPELMIGGNPLAYLHAKLGGWGAKGLSHLEPQALAEYERCFTLPPLSEGGLLRTVHTVCEDYRASADIDLVHDRESRARGDKVACDLRVLWGANGIVHRLFRPLALWQAQCAGEVTGVAMPCGHFIPEELPAQTIAELRQWHGAVA
jgi:haloacetate dehalogenase